MKNNSEQGVTYNSPNDRYNRKYLRPIAKSVYQNNKVIRLNGSLNSAVNSTMMDSNKALQANNHQIAMTQTFNMSILNNSFTGKMKPFMTQTITDANNTISSSPRRIRSIASESLAPFTVIPNAKIPDLTEQRREERSVRAENLLRRPKHKELINAANMS